MKIPQYLVGAVYCGVEYSMCGVEEEIFNGGIFWMPRPQGAGKRGGHFYAVDIDSIIPKIYRWSSAHDPFTCSVDVMADAMLARGYGSDERFDAATLLIGGSGIGPLEIMDSQGRPI